MSKENTSWFQRLMSVSIWEKAEPFKLESSGKGITSYRDPTADAAIENVMREEKRKAKNMRRKEGEQDDRVDGA